MVGIEADADEFAGASHAGAITLDLDDWQGSRIDSRELLQSVGRNRIACDVFDVGGEITHLAVLVDKAGLFLTNRTIAQEFHGITFS